MNEPKKHIIPPDKRKLILDAAIKTFAQKGYSQSSIIEVAKLANVAVGTVYIYFQNKDDLLIQCMHEIMDSRLTQIKAEAAKADTAMERLYQFFIKHIELFSQNPDYARLMVVEVRQSEEFYKRYPTYNPLNDYLEYVRTLVQNAIDEGSIKQVDAKALAFLIIGAMDLSLTQWLIGDEKLDLIQMTDNIRRILATGIAIG